MWQSRNEARGWSIRQRGIDGTRWESNDRDSIAERFERCRQKKEIEERFCSETAHLHARAHTHTHFYKARGALISWREGGFEKPRDQRRNRMPEQETREKAKTNRSTRLAW